MEGALAPFSATMTMKFLEILFVGNVIRAVEPVMDLILITV